VLTGQHIEVLDTADAAAARAAHLIAVELRDAVAERGNATLALSGGRTPGHMLPKLAREALPWENIHIFQVDERVAPDGDADRNDTQIREAFVAQIERRPERFHRMPVTMPDLDAAAREYASALRAAAGAPPILDVVHLGLGADGHTASIFPRVVLDEGRDVAVTVTHASRRRMTLTIPIINRARSIVWLVTGPDKAKALARLLRAEPGLVATRVRRTSAAIVADADANGSGVAPRS
jgi:6-phosphogluconolactonase